MPLYPFIGGPSHGKLIEVPDGITEYHIAKPPPHRFAYWGNMELSINLDKFDYYRASFYIDAESRPNHLFLLEGCEHRLELAVKIAAGRISGDAWYRPPEGFQQTDIHVIEDQIERISFQSLRRIRDQILEICDIARNSHKVPPTNSTPPDRARTWAANVEAAAEHVCKYCGSQRKLRSGVCFRCFMSRSIASVAPPR